MKSFAALYAELDETTRTNDKVAALVRYFRAAPAGDAAWAVFFLTGQKPKQVVASKRIRAWAAEAAGVQEWLFDECYDSVGDLAETVALLLPPPSAGAGDRPLAEWVQARLLPLRGMDEAAQKSALTAAWGELDGPQRYLWNKLITGSFRVGVSRLLVVRALAEVSGLPAPTVAHRLMGTWEPTPDSYARLIAPETKDADVSRPYPFFLASQLDDPPETLGDVSGWQAEWKWDGIRSQLVRRGGRVFLWSRGEELVTDRYPEIASAGEALPAGTGTGTGTGTVIDGEILPWDAAAGAPMPFTALQRRIGRKTLGKKLLAEVPCVLVAYDLLEEGGADLRELPLRERRRRLERLVAATAHPALRISPVVAAASWAELAKVRAESRDRRVEGLMLKAAGSPYRVGRVRGDWWKWKVAPLTVDAVLIYAQRGHGKRAGLYTDYTFGVWDAGKLVPFAKAYSGLTDAEIRDVDAFVRANTLEKFGPVRTVRPELVFELAFEGLNRSTRHKSGIAVRFPRMLRRRPDKKPEEADTLERIRAMLTE
jgi:DNA ligase-1